MAELNSILSWAIVGASGVILTLAAMITSRFRVIRARPRPLPRESRESLTAGLRALAVTIHARPTEPRRAVGPAPLAVGPAPVRADGQGREGGR